MEGEITEDICSRSLRWLQQQDNDTEPWLWKFPNCFSAAEQKFPLTPQTSESMENKKATVELREAPSPQFAVSQFAAVPLPDAHALQQKKLQLVPRSKVSCCTHGSDSSSHPPQLHFGGGDGDGGSSVGGGNLIHPGTVLNSQSTGTITCQIGSGLGYHSASSLKNAPARSGVAGVASNLSGVCLENSVASCPHFPCCGKLQFPSCHSNLHKLHPFPLHQSCTTSGYFSCSEYTGGATGLLEEHVTQTERTSCVCTNSLHLNVAPSVCLKGSPYCTECLSKPSRESLVEAAKIWPNIPPPSAQVAAPVALPVCNGCGTKGTRKEKSLLLASSFGQLPQKYVSSEVGIAGQLLENLPPIGVFWDIENCSVPSGRSAVAVVQRIREKFFKGHREAEFICVCDISKENKEVIEELNNCQVTVAHINATAKNAADDKLRQSLRRFADTHSAPATVVLVSTDVNFALEISDLRHRHGFHIILVHKNQASEALLHHAHELVRFEEFISDLPPRLPLKKPACHTLLYVYNLPTNRDSKSVCYRLRRLSDNCGGKVLTISGSSAILRFLNQDSAERAQKRMENEDVFGNRIVVSFTPKNKELAETKSELCRLESKTVRNSENRQGQLKEDALHCKPTLMQQTVCPSQPKRQEPGNAFIKTVKSMSTTIQFCHNVSQPDGLIIAFFFNTGKICLQPEVSTIPLWRKKKGTMYSKSVSPNISSRSSPLTFNVINHPGAADCLDPYANGADVQISNIDYRLSRKDLQQTIQETFSRHGKCPNAYGVPLVMTVQEPSVTVNYEHDFDPDSYKIPFVILSLKAFAPQVHSLLQTHEGTVPLLSFPDCYASEFSHLQMVLEGQGGVPLEHLITCVPGVNITTAQNGIKVIKWIHNKPPPPTVEPWLLRSKSPVGNPQLIQFSREVIDLLKNQPSCIIPVSKFIPTYHHHFAKQCRVSDYGYSRLMELLEAVPHVLQILGIGTKRLLTLTHRAQVKRFTQDLLKLLKSQASKQVVVKEFLQAYHWCFSKDWDVTEYGVCELVDLISEIPDTTICLSQQDNEMVICIPKRERTKEEIERTKQFSKEVVDLLRHQPYFRMPFNKFIPSYHHHFGRQCKLAYYGFTKLLELFEAIPDVLQVGCRYPGQRWAVGNPRDRDCC
ncbi:hypothetical protein JRQ81_010166 [Phrynocephalus forsythii]|uniref:Meiosis regulator and mRNA stability factor 1 n=1 Tax=Phrynocephalus forsythii TaxID=171643 RepID=A0A9Q1ARM4_9SAUR|nr:hypothetical protein JRQ81_010166 [Phrynocephalus forsythii]